MITLGIVSASLMSVKVNATNIKSVPPNVILQGETEGIVFIDDDKPFLESYGMLPGDSISRGIVIKNNWNTPFKVYMRAERVTPKEEYDLLNKLYLEIKNGENLIYEGSVSGNNYLISDIYLGTYKPGEESNLYAKVYLDGESIGNEYKNKSAQVNWIFTATSYEDENQLIPQIKPNVKPSNPVKSPYTGDSGIAIYIVLVVVTIFLLRGKLFKELRKEEG